MKPTMNVVEIHQQGHLLSGSGVRTLNNNANMKLGDGYNGTARSRDYEWEGEEEEEG
jgi:hypothetical protein